MSDHDYFVSVVIPNYNYEQYVGQAIESALAQTHDNLEVVVVDDGSSDGSVDVIKSFGPPVRLVEQENQHLSAARNSGIRAARGTWIALLDSDDVWHPRKLECQIKALAANPGWCYVATAVSRADEFPDFAAMSTASRELTLDDFLTVTPMSASDALIKKSCFDASGMFDPALRSCEDRDMWLRLAAQFRGGRIEAPLWHYRQHPAQMNRNVQTMIDTRKRVLGNFFAHHRQPIALRRKAWSHHFYDSSISHRDNGGSLLRAAWYGAASLLCSPDNYHQAASTGKRLRSLAVTLRELARERGDRRK